MSNGGSARIGIDLGGTKIEGIRLEADGAIGDRIRTATPRNDYQGSVAAIVDLVHRLDPGGGAKVGVGAPGSWLEKRGRMQNCNSTWLNGRPLLPDLNQALAGRVRVANDADCFTLSEAHGGSAEGRGVVFGVILGTGVGGGIAVGGRLLTGPNGLVGEWGHTPLAHLSTELSIDLPIKLPMRTCYCGRPDCVETYLSGPGLLNTHLSLWPEEEVAPATAQSIYERSRLNEAPGDWWRGSVTAVDEVARARATLALYCRMLAENLARIVNTLDPDAIVLGGGLSQMQEIYVPVRELMAPHVFGEVFETELLAPAFGATSGVRGAAWLWAPEEC